MAEFTQLGRYQLRGVLGRGAMGVVYEGFDPTIGRRVAVKTILKNAAIDEETARAYSALFAREAQAAGRLSHPNIIQIYDFAEERDIAYLVMEYIEGRELRSYFEAKEKFDAAETVCIMGELLDALDFAHEAGVIHRDIKPANVMLDARRRVKLADFGVARIQESERSAAGTMVGTPAFMSPEQISGGRIDRRTDLFSAGVVFYQMLTGEQPFTGQGAWTVAKKIMETDPPPPSAVVTNVSPVYDTIVDKALAKNPAERFASAKEFALALRATLGGGAQAIPVAAPNPRRRAKPDAHAVETELKFWRAVQNSADAHELEFYLEKYPDGTYAPLARHKVAKLRESAPQEAQATVRIATEEKARQEAEASVKREAVEKAKREATARARPVGDEDVTVAIGNARPAPPPAPRKTSYALPALAATVVIAGGIGAYLLLGRTPAPVVQAPAPPKVETPVPAAPPKAELSAAETEKIRKETEERIRREYADKSVAEQTVVAKAAADKAVQEKQLATKAAAEKAVAERVAAAEKAARVAAEKAAEEKAAAVKMAEKAAALAKAPPVSVAAAAPAASPREGVLPGRYAFRIMAGSGYHPNCDRIDLQEDIEIRAGSSQSISGRDVANLRFQSAQDGSVAATLQGVSTPSGAGDTKLAGRTTATGYAGTYVFLSGNVHFICTGQWTLVRKGS